MAALKGAPDQDSQRALRAMLDGYLAERRARPLAGDHGIPRSSGDEIADNYKHHPAHSRYFPKRASFARRLFLRGLREGFIPSIWYDSIGGIAEHIVPLGRTLRVIGKQYPVQTYMNDGRDQDPDYIRGVLATPGERLPVVSFDTVLLLVDVGGLYAIVEISSDYKCCSAGFLAPGTGEEGARDAFEQVAREECVAAGAPFPIIPLAEMRFIEEGEDTQGVVQVVELPPGAFDGRLRFGGGEGLLHFYLVDD